MRIFIVFTIFLLISFPKSNDGSNRFNIFDIASELIDATKGAIESLPLTIPKPDEFFELGKNALFGIPYQVAFELINQFCTAAISTHSVIVKEKYTPNIGAMSFILRGKTANITVPLSNSTALWSHQEFRRDCEFVLFVTGWKTNLQEGASTAQDTMAAAYACRGNVNFVVLDTAAFVDTLYAWSAFNTQAIGNYVALALQMLVNSSFPLDKIHVIGHSLGAQICGAAGRTFTELTQLSLPRITGLDPANPCFSSGELLTGLFRGDAVFVDVIHTNPGVLGKGEAIGDIDFFCNGLNALQPGCFSIHCSHGRAWQYYAETVYPGSENNFLAIRCTSMTALNSDLCHGKPVSMGYAISRNIKGNFFLKTRDRAPYGMYAIPNTRPICVA